MREGISPSHINIHQDLRGLESGDWIESSSNWNLLPKSLILIEQIESYFKIQKKKSSQVMGPDYPANIEKYQLLFPKKKLPSGKIGRSALSNVETNFKWFFENHKYTWETILQAAAVYVDEYEKKSPAYLYMRTSAYFIRKTEQDKSVVSDLANYCDIVESGEDFTEDTHFSDKVV